MTLSGMDVQSILAVSERLGAQAPSLDQVVRAVDSLVELAGREWRGPDVSQFRAQWENRYRRMGMAASGNLRELAGLARRNAEAQRATSDTLEYAAAGGAPATLPAGGSGGSGESGGNWFTDGLSWLGRQADAGVAWVSDGAEWVVDRVVDGAEWVVDGVQTTAGWLNDGLHAGQAWMDDKVDGLVGFLNDNDWADQFIPPSIQATIPALWRLTEAGLTIPSQLLRDVANGQAPQAAELLASVALILGTAKGVELNVLSGQDLGFFEPGEPSAGAPVPSQQPPIRSFEDLTAATMAAYEPDSNGETGIRVDTIVGTDGVTRYIVNIPGTQAEIGQLSGWSNNENSRNWAANLWAVSQGSYATDAQAAWQAMQNAGVPAGAPVVLTGHSQGGIIAANLAADPRFAGTYDVAGVVTYGSPIDCADLRAESPPVLSVQHDNAWLQVGDIVPQLDLAGINVLGQPVPQQGSVTVIGLPPRGDSFIDMDANHNQLGYQEDLQSVTPAQQQAIDGFVTANGFDAFFSGTVTDSVRVPTYGQPK